jgi:hypothetical protein
MKKSISSLIKKITNDKKYVSDFVKKQIKITLESKIRYVVWDSMEKGTYIKAKHGELI